MRLDLTGQRFGRLTAISRSDKDYITPSTGKHHSLWICQCDCGNITTVSIGQLRSGGTKSCGCLQRQRSAEAHTKHGFRFERLHGVWSNMKNRCNNKNCIEYPTYGGRGITVCAEWNEYPAFRAWALEHGYDETLPRCEQTLDRIDVNKGYSPDNCRWANMSEQANNKTDTVYFDYNGRKCTISEISELTSLSYNYLYYRLRTKKMTVNEIIESTI